MNKQVKSICPITKKEDYIRKSHIYPKFMWKYLKKTGGTVFRNAANPTKELQNGEVINLLGEQAELMFSKRELWFEKNIFTPYTTSPTINNRFSYNSELYYFAISLLWRVLFVNRNNVNQNIACIIEEVLEDWRSFLNEEIEVPRYFHNIYIMPLDSEKLGLPPNIFDIDFYLLRQFDANIMTACFSKDIAVYCKLPRFCIWGQLQREDAEVNYGLKINPRRGVLKFKKFNIGSGIVKGYIINRIYESADIAEDVSNKLSDKVQDTIVNRIKKSMEKKPNSELGGLLLCGDYIL